MTEQPPLFLIEGQKITAEDIATLYENLTGKKPQPAEMQAVHEMLERKALQRRSGG